MPRRMRIPDVMSCRILMVDVAFSAHAAEGLEALFKGALRLRYHKANKDPDRL